MYRGTALKNSHYNILTLRKNKKKYPVNMNAVTGSKFVCNGNNRTFYYECRKDIFKFCVELLSMIHPIIKNQ